ncbi:MAG: hypothetical protein R3B81_07860 [bacterium]
MKVQFSQADFVFAERTVPLVKRVATRLEMTKMLSSVMIDVIDYGSPAARNPSDSIEIYSNGGVRLHLRYDHFLKRKYRDDPRRHDISSLPARAFDSVATQEVLYRLLLQWRDVQEWGIPENQDDEFLCVWNVHVAGRLDRMNAPCASKTAHWEEFLRVFAKGEHVSAFLVLFEVLWKCEDLGKWGLTDVLYRVRASRQYRPLAAERQETAR